MRLTLTTIVGIDSCFQFIRTQDAQRQTGATSGLPAAALAAAAGHNRPVPWDQDRPWAGSVPAVYAWPLPLSNNADWAGRADSTRLHRQSPAPMLAGSWPAGSA